ATSTRGVRTRIRRVAGCAPPTGSAGHAGAAANLKLTFHLDHSAGADDICLGARARWTLEITEISGSDLPFHVNLCVFPFRTFITSAGRKHARHVPPSRRTLG